MTQVGHEVQGALMYAFRFVREDLTKRQAECAPEAFCEFAWDAGKSLIY